MNSRTRFSFFALSPCPSNISNDFDWIFYKRQHTRVRRKRTRDVLSKIFWFRHVFWPMDEPSLTTFVRIMTKRFVKYYFVTIKSRTDDKNVIFFFHVKIPSSNARDYVYSFVVVSVRDGRQLTKKEKRWKILLSSVTDLACVRNKRAREGGRRANTIKWFSRGPPNQNRLGAIIICFFF